MIEVVWSNQANAEYWGNIDYVLEKWTPKEAMVFTDKVDQIIEQLKSKKVTFKPTNRKNIYQITVVKQITLFYEVQQNKITLLRFWNNRKNPEKLKF